MQNSNTNDLPVEFWDDETQTKLENVDWDIWQGVLAEEIHENGILTKIRMHCRRYPDEFVRERRIDELKSNLASTDYVVQKITEAQVGAIIIPEDDQRRYEGIIKQRQAWREEINRLEVNDQ